MSRLTRRSFLRGSTAGVAALATSGLWRPGLTSARARSLARALAPEGTTLEMALGLPDGSGYRRMTELPGWPIEVRGELSEPKDGREERRRSLASIVHLTDIHIVDAQSPARVEFIDRYADGPGRDIPISSAWRPQETLSPHIADAMVRRINQVGVGPVTGRRFDAAVSTGDATDNQQYNELGWMLTALDGGRLTGNSGDPDRYEGVQDAEPTTFDDHYWHPDEDAVHPLSGAEDRFRRDLGFPVVNGLFGAAITPFTAQGLACPWYSCYGNHDGLLQGNAPAMPPFSTISTSNIKVVNVPVGSSPDDLQHALTEGDPAFLGSVLSGPGRTVTADPERAPVGSETSPGAPSRTAPIEWAEIHHEDRGGPGPVGHGYGERALTTGELYFTFDLGEGVLGVVLDSVNRGGVSEGSLGQAQLDWLEEQLAAVHGHYFDEDGQGVRTQNTDRLVVLFSHHNSGSMNNPMPDPWMPDDRRILGDEVIAFLHRFPNVIAWINGHSHVNRVWPRSDPSGRTGGYWEINTAAHIDAPQHARIVEVADNRDGTLSIFGTLVDHAGPTRAARDDHTPLGLASLARELAHNDPQAGTPGATGTPSDRNVELLLTRPFSPTRETPATPTPDQRPAPDQRPTPDQRPARVRGLESTPAPVAAASSPPLPTTGGGAVGLAGGAAAVAAAAALRGRERRPDDG